MQIDQSREDVWWAISDLFLDTELSEQDFAQMAANLADSPFTIDELNSIFENEVAPVLHGNLKQVAGVWGSFDRDEIMPLLRSRAASLEKRQEKKGFAIVEKIKRAFVLAETGKDWQRVLKAIREIRGLST